MSMLTPLGSGGQRRGSRRGRRRVTIALVVVVALTAAGAGAWWWFTQRTSTSAPTARTAKVCVTPTPSTPSSIPPPPQVRVAVLNGTTRAGLAIATANTLVVRTFDVIAIGNAPRPLPSGVGVIRYGKSSTGAAIRLGSYLPGVTLQLEPDRSTRTVQLMLGPEYTQVSSATQAQANLKRVALPQPPAKCRTTRVSASS